MKSDFNVIIMRVMSTQSQETKKKRLLITLSVFTSSESDSAVLEAAVIVDDATTSTRFWALFPFSPRLFQHNA